MNDNEVRALLDDLRLQLVNIKADPHLLSGFDSLSTALRERLGGPSMNIQKAAEKLYKAGAGHVFEVDEIVAILSQHVSPSSRAGEVETVNTNFLVRNLALEEAAKVAETKFAPTEFGRWDVGYVNGGIGIAADIRALLSQ